MTAKTDSKSLLALVQSRHPEFGSLEAHWRFVLSTYEGGRDWFKENLFTYHKEGDGEFKNRIERAYRFNHTREVVDLLDKYLFKQDVQRSADAPEYLKEFWKNATLTGLPIDSFARHMSNRSSIFGRVAIVVDSNVPADRVLSEADRKAGNYRVYAYTVDAGDLLDYSFDDQGELNWVLVREYSREDTDPFAAKKQVQPQYRLWTRDYSLLVKTETRGTGTSTSIKPKEHKLVEHSLGVVPVVLLDNKIGLGGYSAPGLIDDIAYLDRANANYLSNLDAIIQDQTYSQLVMPAQGLMPGDDGYDKLVEAGTKRIFTYDGESGQVPTYIFPDVKQAGLILEVISKIINEIYHSVGLAGERTKQDNAMGIDNSSGVAKAYDFERVNALLVSKADALEQAELKIARLVALYNSDKNLADGLVIYPDDFDARGLYDELDIASRLQALQAPKNLRREQIMKVVDKLYPHLSAKVLKSIKDEVSKEWLELQDVADPANPSKPAPVAKSSDPKRTGQGTNNKDNADKSAPPKPSKT